MSVFNESLFIKKLSDLNETQQSIQTLSLFIIHHRKHSKEFVQVWLKELYKTSFNRKLIFLYLANDIIQNSRRKGQELQRDFKSALISAYRHVLKNKPDEKTRAAMNRLLNIWNDRSIYDGKYLDLLKGIMLMPNQKIEDPNLISDIIPFPAESPTDSIGKSESPDEIEKGPEHIFETIEPREDINIIEIPDVPLPEVLIKHLQKTENLATSDEFIRKKIADLPSNISDLAQINKVEDKREARKLKKQVDEAAKMIINYNKRLDDELDERKAISLLLQSFLKNEKQKLDSCIKNLKEQNKRLDQVVSVRKELKAHIDNLPDLHQLPTDTSMIPLPSAGDLFNTQNDLNLI